MQVFDGPLDLLLEEVRRQNVAVEDVAMAPMVAAYLEYIRTAQARNWKLDMEWLYLAATLIEWKTRALLPRPDGPDPIRDQLVERLLAHKKEAAAELARRHARESAHHGRPTPPVAQEPTEETGFISVWDLLHQARELAAWARSRRQFAPRWEDLWVEAEEEVSVAQIAEELIGRLEISESLNLSGYMAAEGRLPRRMAAFLGALELVRSSGVEMYQDGTFAPLWIQRRRINPAEN